MKRHLTTLFIMFFLGFLASTAVEAQEGGAAGTIEAIRVEGNKQIPTETILLHSSLKVGDRYDEEALFRDFRDIFRTGFFKDLKIDVTDGQKGKIITYIVVEKPLIASVEFAGNQKISTSDINKRLKEKGLKWEEGSPLDEAKLEKAKEVIRELMEEKGFQFGSVETTVTDAENGRKKVTFQIDEGGKVHVAQVDFEGNDAFGEGKLRGAMKYTKKPGFFSFITKSGKYDQRKLEEDLERLRSFYLNRGYLDVAIGEPQVEAKEVKGKGKGVWVEIPIDEGERFTVSQVNIGGNTVFPTPFLLDRVQLKKNQPYREKNLNATLSAIGEEYGTKGYFQAFINPIFQKDREKKTVAITLDIDERDRYYLNRVEFTGNTTTKDKVIRRQMKIREGDLFDTRKFRRSLYKIYQLGYFGPPNPKVEPSPEDPTKLNVTINLEEKGKNDIRFGGGVSGVEGAFFTLAFATRNLLGTGMVLDTEVIAGKRTRNYNVQFLEPYLMDRPISLGVNGFRRDLEYPQFTQKSTGGNLSLGLQFTDFLFGRVTYGYEKVSVEDVLEGITVTDPFTQALLSGEEFRKSSITPSFIYSSVDNPMDPFKGFRQIITFQWAGGVLGGTTDLYSPQADTAIYLPFGKRSNVALHGEFRYVKARGDTQIPIFERFFLGGERDIRGFRLRTISPVDESGVSIGGTKAVIFNTEYQVKLMQAFRAVFFFDAGNAFAEEQTIKLNDLKYSFGLEFRFFTPLLQAPLRLIYAVVPDHLADQPKTDFTFSIGTTF
jgi:outer membrane protein insertion porin family